MEKENKKIKGFILYKKPFIFFKIKHNINVDNLRWYYETSKGRNRVFEICI